MSGMSSTAAACGNKRPASSSEEESPSFSRKALKSNSAPADMASNEAASSSVEVKGRFTLPEEIPKFTWKPPKAKAKFINPARMSHACARLLLDDSFIDKSAALYNLLEDCFDSTANDFGSIPLLLVYPRRFAKTTLLAFIEAVFSPVPMLGLYEAEKVRAKIAALDFGKQLLEYGWRPVVCLDLQGVCSVKRLKNQVMNKLGRAGLEKSDLEMLLTSHDCPADLLYNGVTKLNENFEKTFGVRRNTIVLIDEYDKLFRDREVDIYEIDERKDSEIAREKKRTIAELFNIFGLGKEDGLNGISLLVLCGLTRMVGSGLSKLNNLVDVSRWTTYHGLCGISAKELVFCADGQLDESAHKSHGVTFENLLKNKFIPDWQGFRFGIDDKIGVLDPNTSEGALFSPLDVWEIVLSLLENDDAPSSRWIQSMASEFEFTAFAEKYKSSIDGAKELFLNLKGGWVNNNVLEATMNRQDYMLLKTNTHVKKVLFELGLLSVKRINKEKQILLGSPNWLVTRNATSLLVKVATHGVTPEELARKYLGDGFGKIVSDAAKVFTNVYSETGQNVVREYGLQDCLFVELLLCFPSILGDEGESITNYALFKEMTLGNERVDMAVELFYKENQKMAFMVDVQFATIAECDADSISNTHKTNITAGEKQVLSYTWREQVKTEQRVVVSGVWHPSDPGGPSYELNTQFKFVSLKKRGRKRKL